MRYIFLILFLLYTSVCQAAAPARQSSYVSGTIISSSAVTANEDALFNYLTAGVEVYADGTIVNADVNSSANIQSDKLNLTSIAQGVSITSGGSLTNAGTTTLNGTTRFGGSTDDSIYTTITVTNPTSSNKTITIPNANSVTLPSGAVFFMATGSCPPGTTNVSSSYSNKYIKINATAGTSAGVVFTNTSDSTDPGGEAHTHTVTASPNGAGGGGTCPQVYTSQDCSSSFTSNAASSGAGNSHTHPSTSASTLEPSSITMILCQVD